MTTQERPAPSTAAAASPAEEQGSVFISYRHEDRGVADDLFTLLGERRVSAWYDPLIPHGTDWREAIVAQLGKARVMVILLSAGESESEELKKELAVAVQEKVPLLAVRLAEVKLSGAFAYELAGSQWFDLFPDRPGRLAALADLLAKLVRTPRAARWHPTAVRRAGGARRLAGNNLLLLTLLFFVSALVLALYERSAGPLEELTAAGVIAPWRAWLYVVFVSTIGSPLLFLTRALHGIQAADLPLLAATAANTVLLILLARNLVAWLRLRLLAARASR